MALRSLPSEPDTSIEVTLRVVAGVLFVALGVSLLGLISF